MGSGKSKPGSAEPEASPDVNIDELTKVKKEKAALEAQNRGQELMIKDLEKRVALSEKKRAALHNQLQEMKGNIRVYCRVRPRLPKETAEMADLNFDSTGDRPAILMQFRGAGNRKQKIRFEFDEVFRLESSQRAVFDEVEPLLQSVMDGYKACIFAYGQTGSGKTFTMEGRMGASAHVDDRRGVVPRCMQRLLQIRDDMQQTGWDSKMTVTAVEIYNEQIRDLLSDARGRKHEVLTEKDSGETYVSQATVVNVATEEEMYKVVREASGRRETAMTHRNPVSSRSHLVIQIRAHSANSQTGEKVLGILNMVDLAGSERMSDENEEARVREGQNINKSLSCLLGVITALASKQSHVPFRDTKLTHLLQSSLSGHGKAIMFANVSPLAVHVAESLNTLRFATQVSSVQLGTGKHQAHQLHQPTPLSSSPSHKSLSPSGKSPSQAGQPPFSAWQPPSVACPPSAPTSKPADCAPSAKKLKPSKSFVEAPPSKPSSKSSGSSESKRLLDSTAARRLLEATSAKPLVGANSKRGLSRPTA